MTVTLEARCELARRRRSATEEASRYGRSGFRADCGRGPTPPPHRCSRAYRGRVMLLGVGGAATSCQRHRQQRNHQPRCSVRAAPFMWRTVRPARDRCE